MAAILAENERYLEGAMKFLDIARGRQDAPDKVEEHYGQLDLLNREVRAYTSGMFKAEMPYERADLVASLIEEEDHTASLGEALYQIARRVERQPFGEKGRPLVDAMLDQVGDAMRLVADPAGARRENLSAEAAPRIAALGELRAEALRLNGSLPWVERGAILALLGSAERAYFLIERIDAERRSVSRAVPAPAEATREVGGFGAAPVPA